MWTLKLINDYKRLSKIEEFIRRAKIQGASPEKENSSIERKNGRDYERFI